MQIKRVLGAAVTGILLFYLTACGKDDVSRLQAPAVQLAVVNREPVKLENGRVYRYNTDGSWEQTGPDGEAVQIVDGEHLCVLDTEGRLYCDWIPTDEPLPLTSGYAQYMAELALEINETEPFVCANQEISRLSFRALLQSGEILFQSGDEYAHLPLDELPVSLSGEYILTDAGNIWYMSADEDVSEVECVYDGGDIIEIDANNNGGRCLGLTEDHHVVSLHYAGRALEVSDWSHIVSIEQEFNYALGLTDKGEVLYAAAGYANESPKNTEASVKEALSEWFDVVQIAANGSDIVGLKQDGSCYILDLSDYSNQQLKAR